MGLFDFVLGRCVVITSKKTAAKLLNVCMKSEAEYWNPHFDGENFFMECSARNFRKIKSACGKRGIEITLTSRNGLP